MKRWFTLFILTTLTVILTTTTGYSQYKPGSHTIGVNATVLTEPTGWGANYDYGYDENLSLGFVMRYWSPPDVSAFAQTGEITKSRETYMAQFQALYHALPKIEWDPFGGVRFGYSYYNETITTSGIWTSGEPEPKANSGISLSIVGGVRYFVMEQVSLGLVLEYFLYNDEDYFDNQSDTGLGFDISFTLK